MSLVTQKVILLTEGYWLGLWCEFVYDKYNDYSKNDEQ